MFFLFVTQSFEYIFWMNTCDRSPLSPRATSNVCMSRRAGRQKPVFWCMLDWLLLLFGATPSWEQFGKVRCLHSSQLSGLAELSNLPLSGLGRAACQFTHAVVTEQCLQMRRSREGCAAYASGCSVHCVSLSQRAGQEEDRRCEDASVWQVRSQCPWARRSVSPAQAGTAGGAFNQSHAL